MQPPGFDAIQIEAVIVHRHGFVCSSFAFTVRRTARQIQDPDLTRFVVSWELQ
jgi:hypothetical protein